MKRLAKTSSSINHQPCNGSVEQDIIMILRQACSDDIGTISAIDSSASYRFKVIPALADLAGDDEQTSEKVRNWLANGRVYIIEDIAKPRGFVAAHQQDSILHIDEISVSLESQGKGLGATLLNAVIDWAGDIARHSGTTSARVSLTTYPDVPWNGPWYRKHGFKEVEAENVGAWLVAQEHEERWLVREGYRRCCMLKEALLELKTEGLAH